MFGISGDVVGHYVDIVKKVLTEVAKWIWSKIKDYVKDHWERIAIVILVTLVIFLGKIILTGLAFQSTYRLP